MTQADIEAAQQLDRLVDLQRRREQLAKSVPPDVRTEKIEQPDGTILFRFSHGVLGELGQLRITPVPSYMAMAGQCVVNVEIFADDPDKEPRWDEKYRLLDTMATLCITALPGEQTRSPLPPLSIAKEQRRLYIRFTACRHSNELRAFVMTLSDEEYQRLQTAVQQASVTASPENRAGLLQRMDDLHRLWWECHPDEE